MERKNIKSIYTVPLHDFHKIWRKLGCLHGVGMPKLFEVEKLENPADQPLGDILRPKMSFLDLELLITIV